MASKYWIGGATAVAQVESGSIDSVDATPANNTFTITVGDASVSVAGDTDVATTAAALVSAANGSTHPHLAAITWANPSAGNITATADTAGVEFTASLTETGAGTGTVTDFSSTTANAGPSTYSTGANWSDGSAPGASDDVTIDKNGERILFGLDASAVALTSLTIRGNVVIGLDPDVFTDTVDEATPNTGAVEYRQSYLKVNCPRVDIGQWLGVGSVTASQRTKIEQSSTAASVITVYNTAATSLEADLPPCRLLASDADCDVVIRDGVVGIAVEKDETSTVGEIFLIDVGGNSQCVVGSGTTLTTYSQRRGTGLLQAAATITTVTCDGGELSIEGDFTVTTMNVREGVVYDGHIKTGAAIITTLNMVDGTLDLQRNREARTITTVNHDGGAISGNESITFTTYNQPSVGDWELSVA